MPPSPPRPPRYPASVDWDLPVPDWPLVRLLDEAVAGHGAGPALEFLGRSWTYDEVDAIAARAAAGLRRRGIGPGSQVGLLLPNTPYYVIAFFAVLRAGGTVVNYSPLASPRELARQIRDSDTRILITVDHPALLGRAELALRETEVAHLVVCPLADVLPTVKSLLWRTTALLRGGRDVPTPTLSWAELTDAAGDPEPVEIDPRRAVAALQYTSGTTGAPKGVCLTHRNLVANATQLAAFFTAADPGRERLLALLPFSHAFGLSAVLGLALRLGAELVLQPRFEPAELRRAILRRRPTMLAAVPAVFRTMLRHPTLSKLDLSCFKVFVSGGDALAPELRRAFSERFGRPITQGYGLTECGPVVTCGNPLEDLDRADSVGLPLPGTGIHILSLDDGRTPAPSGAQGEICISGPQVMAGYWRQPEATRAVLHDGLMHTGDVGFVDADGFLHVSDRIKEIIVTKGFNVYPTAVEQALMRHPAVADAAVVGLPDATRGEVVTAAVVCAPERTLTLSELQEFLADLLSEVEIPRRLALRDALPKSPMGKTLRAAVRDEMIEDRAKPG